MSVQAVSRSTGTNFQAKDNTQRESQSLQDGHLLVELSSQKLDELGWAV